MSIWRKIRDRFAGGRLVTDFDDDLAWVHPPNTTSDPMAWDEYWHNLLERGPQFHFGPRTEDMFVNDTVVVDMTRQLGFTSVLCAGSGISQEPRALASAGLKVVALDLSPAAHEIAQGWDFDDEYSRMLLDPSMRTPGGSLEYVVGDLLDTDICPGPFDVVIERRTVQLFGPKIDDALAALARRLSSPGVFLTHCHDAKWRPPQPRVPVTEKWFELHGWSIMRTALVRGDQNPDQIAWPMLSTG
jgi:SAM-dependent methyltransferase